jgi:uncharacterized protein (DUF1786 family)
MKILAIDIGTGTQDILLFDSRREIENCYKLILPSPTLIFSQKIKQATRQRLPILLTGVMMGGGPITLAVESHLKAGLSVFATEAAAQTFNDDLSIVQGMGVVLVNDTATMKLHPSLINFELKDLDLPALKRAFSNFNVSLGDLDAIAVAVLDHGAAPSDVSDRIFRFEYLQSRICDQNRLSAFAYACPDIPSTMTRFLSVASSLQNIKIPVILMDTASASVLGATFDKAFTHCKQSIIVNIGNSHTLAFHLSGNNIIGLFEHHTNILTQDSLERNISLLVSGTLTNIEIFNCGGHGALIFKKDSEISRREPPKLLVTGPRRNLMLGSKLNPIFAAPFGDMMTTGCIGLLAATAELLPEFGEHILASLQNKVKPIAPWEENPEPPS